MTSEDYNDGLASDVGSDIGSGSENSHSHSGSTGSSIVEIGHQSEMIGNNDDDIVNLELEDHNDEEGQNEENSLESEAIESNAEGEEVNQSEEEDQFEHGGILEEENEPLDNEDMQDKPMAEDLDQHDSIHSDSAGPEDFHTVDPINIDQMDPDKIDYVIPQSTAESKQVEVKPVEPEQMEPIEIAEVDPIPEDDDMVVEENDKQDAPNTSTLQFPSSSQHLHYTF